MYVTTVWESEPGAMGTLFNRFSHGNTHTSAGDRPRYGIGLSLVREIAHAHGGKISVAQTPGGGATLTLTIPAAPIRAQVMEECFSGAPRRSTRA